MDFKLGQTNVIYFLVIRPGGLNIKSTDTTTKIKLNTLTSQTLLGL